MTPTIYIRCPHCKQMSLVTESQHHLFSLGLWPLPCCPPLVTALQPVHKPVMRKPGKLRLCLSLLRRLV